MEKEILAKYIDHTILTPSASNDEVLKICEEAKKYNFASVCVNPCYVCLVHKALENTNIKTCTTIGFPLGATTTKVKAFETNESIENGAQEVDMVINIGAVKNQDWTYVKKDIEAVVAAANGRAAVKVIFETCLLTNDEKIKLCQIAKEAGADFIKTSTGFSHGGATTEDIDLMRRTVGPEMGVKASGGIRDLETALAMINSGATRIGASAGVKIIEQLNLGGTL